MPKTSHLERLADGVSLWNEWVRLQRISGPYYSPTRHEGAKVGVTSFWADLSGAELRGRGLVQGSGSGFEGIDLMGADLRNAKLAGSMLAWANLTGATLAGADLSEANLMGARFEGANLQGADLRKSLLGGTNLLHANLMGARINDAYFSETVFSDTDLSNVTGLDQCQYAGPCTVDHRTLFDYGLIPQSFLRGCGLPENLITYLPSLASATI